VDESVIQRSDSMPGPVRDVFGGASLPLLDGHAHRTRKRLVGSAFASDRLASYIPDLSTLIDGFLSDTAARTVPTAAVPSLRRLAIACICKNVMGLDPGPQVDRLVAEYQTVLAAPNGIPLNVPGTSLRRAIAARDRILATFDRLIAQRRAQPRDDGLSVMLQAVATDGERLDDAACRLELHHLVLAGYIVFGELVGAVLQLDRHAAVQARLRDEIDERASARPATLDTLRTLPYLQHVVLELKRHTPVVNIFFGVARRDFELDGYRIPQGRSVMLSLIECNRSSATWSEPERFDPDRFSAERAEHERHVHAYVPQGPGHGDESHVCVGLEYTTVLMSLFLIQLLGGYVWSLPEQDLDYVWSRIPAEPRDGLLLDLRPR
jgi:cytochrome P450